MICYDCIEVSFVKLNYVCFWVVNIVIEDVKMKS